MWYRVVCFLYEFYKTMKKSKKESIWSLRDYSVNKKGLETLNFADFSDWKDKLMTKKNLRWHTHTNKVYTHYKQVSAKMNSFRLICSLWGLTKLSSVNKLSFFKWQKQNKCSPANPQRALKYIRTVTDVFLTSKGMAIATQKLRHKIKFAWKQGNWNTGVWGWGMHLFKTSTNQTM